MAVLAAHAPVTPAGNPENVAPVALVVVNAIFVIALLIQTAWLVPAVIVFRGLTVMVPVVVAGTQPPVVVTV